VGAQTSSLAAPLVVSRHFILGTAGHVDHGKTSLVKALTGTDADRLPEEQRRGMTIELGFAELVVGDTRFGVVDVPGHEKFVKTMVAGATGIDIALLVVAADDSVMPQTVEHLDILHLLGVQRGVVAVTKIDAVDSGLISLVVEEVRTLLAGTALKDAPICPVSSLTGAGLDELKRSILEVSRGIERSMPVAPFRMAVDRVFTVQGRGTVVTGSVLRGEVTPGDSLEVFPGPHSCRIRDLQTHGLQQRALSRGQRAAINLSGIDKEKIERGSELATPGYLRPTRLADVILRCLGSNQRPLRSTTTVRLEVGTTDLSVRVVLWEGDSLTPGASGYAQLRSGEPFTVTYGQRFILRDASATRTLGGGTVLRPVARRKRRDTTDMVKSLERLECGRPVERVEEVLRAAGFTQLTDLQVCARAGVELAALPGIRERLREEKRWSAVGGTDAQVTPSAIADVAVRLTAWLKRFHQTHSDQPGRPADAVLGWLERVTMNRTVARPLFDKFVADGVVRLFGRFAGLPEFTPSLSAADERLLKTMVQEIQSGRFQPPILPELSIAVRGDHKRLARLATLACALGELIAIAPEMYLHADVERELRSLVADLIGRTGPATVAQIREALQSSRKYVVPFVEYLDRVGVTQRVGDQRVLRKTEATS